MFGRGEFGHVEVGRVEVWQARFGKARQGSARYGRSDNLKIERRRNKWFISLKENTNGGTAIRGA